jgi:hypothetical protein
MSDETTVIAEYSRPKRKYSEPTKSDYIIRCMEAENTVKAQDIELRQERGLAIKLHAQLQDAEEQAAKLRARDGKLTTAASVLALLVIVLAGVLIGGAQ